MTQHRKALAAALERIEGSAEDDLIQSRDMRRTDRERAQAAGWLHPIIRGWYVLGPEASTRSGNTVLWYSHFWQFVRQYLNERYGEGYCLNAEASLDLHAGNNTVPQQLIVMTRNGGAQTIELPHGGTIQTYPDAANLPAEVSLHDGIQIMPLATALCRAAPRFFVANAINAEIALNLVRETDLSRALIGGRNTRAASRLMGAYKFLGDAERARRIKQDMQVGVSRISPVNPFKIKQPRLGNQPRVRSPYVARLHALWAQMRPVVVDSFPTPPKTVERKTYLKSLADIYQHDAYNSLSIEGYRVTPEIIERVRIGAWDPRREKDREHVAAMAAKGYFDTFNLVRDAVESVLGGANAADLVEQSLQDWYRTLFGASVQAGILKAVDLAGYRNRPVFIKGSMHVPMPNEALADCMETLFHLLRDEESAAVRAVLGHFLFVFVHPYADGNGRIGRFLMNLMLASGNYSWTVIRLKRRDAYMKALEQASVGGDIQPFTRFVAEELQVDWSKG